MPRNIITTPEQKFSDELKKELKVAKSAKFAVGWFFISGLKEIKKELDGLDSIELLISPSTNRHTAETMLIAEKIDEAVKDELDKRQTPDEKKEMLIKEAELLLQRTSQVKDADFITWLAEKLAKDVLKIHMYTKEVMHAKMYYIEKKNGTKVAFMGSSNISLSGFNLNTELNIRLTNEEQVKKLEKWFNEKWQGTADCDFTFLAAKALEKSWPLNTDVTPFRIYLKILHEFFTIEDENFEIAPISEEAPDLYEFQKDAVIDAYRRLNKYGGLFLADVPGLGKTYMGSALLAHLQEDGRKAIVICPPKLEEQWRDVLDEFSVGTARVISKGKLSAIINDDFLMKREIILVDEAHHFRNPETNMYKDLELICENKKVILVGATPQNLSLMDLYWQLKLFHPNEISDVIKIDPPILKEFFDAAITEREKLDSEGKVDIPDKSEDLFQQLLIRRTRKNIIDEYGKDKLPPFPERVGPFRIDYDIDEVYPGGIYEELNKRIDQINFARYDIGSFIKEDKFSEEEKQRLKVAGRNLKKIMHMILFKLLESSVAAFRSSVDLIYRSHDAFLKGLDEEKVLAGDSADKVYGELRKDIDLEEIDIPEDSYGIDRFDGIELRKAIEKDKIVFREMYAMVKDIKPMEDNKLQTLIKRIKGSYTKESWGEVGNEPCEGKKILIFTQYATTAEYIGEELKKHFGNVDYVSMQTGKVLTKAAYFSPKSSKKYIKRHGLVVDKDNEINILVSTELLSEGMNLQDGQVVINYELHWNPVRIIQRIGRIDRIGSENPKIWVYNFFPQTKADEQIHVQDKIKKRMSEIQSRFGDDSKAVSQDEVLVEKKFFNIYSEDNKSLDEVDFESLAAKQRLNWIKLKDKYPQEYETAINLPTLVRCGLASKNKGLTVYCRTNDYQRLFMAGLDGQITDRNEWKVLSQIECGLDAVKKDIVSGHDNISEKVRVIFEEEVNSNEVQKNTYLDKVKKQAIQRLGKMKRGQNEAFKKKVDDTENLVRTTKLDITTKRKLIGLIRRKHALTDSEVIGEIEGLMENKELEQKTSIKKKYAEVIISESLI